VNQSSTIDASSKESPAGFWRSFRLFNVYRALLGALLLVAILGFQGELSLGSQQRQLFQITATAYFLLACASFYTVRRRWPDLNTQLAFQVSADIVLINLMQHASGGVTSGMGLLLLASIAAAGIAERGPQTLFFAAIATLALLLEQSIQVFAHGANSATFVQAGFLSIGYFAIAGIAHTSARRAQASEAIAAQREVDLANMEEVNQLILQDMQDGVIVIDENGRIRHINARAEESLGRVAQIGKTRLHDFSPQLMARVGQWQLDAASVLAPIRTLSANKKLSVRLVSVGKARAIGAVIFLEDMSRIQAQAQQLKLASLGRLTANIAHEIRNPLSAINHATELLLEETGQHPTQARMLEIIHDNTQRLDRMVQDVLRLNRRDRGLREKFSLIDYLHTFTSQFCDIEKVPPETILLETDLAPEILFDRSHLNQIMWNLCRNALRHGQKRVGSIRIGVSLGRQSGTIDLSVRDDGPGVPEDMRAHLFEPFFTTASGGTGLGLYIAREICEANEGTLDYVEQQAPGAQFKLILKA
jgi:two-component system sensor histidine kinase PilS (NtrC family)